MRQFIFASHGKLAEGLKHSAAFLTGREDIESLCCYLDGDTQSVEDKVTQLMEKMDPATEIVILCDLLGGSVYQKFYPYINERVHLICGMNLPLAMTLILEPDDQLLTDDRIEELIRQSQDGLVHVTRQLCQSVEDEEDE